MRRRFLASFGLLVSCASPNANMSTTSETPPAPASKPPAAQEEDPYLWLEEVSGERALAWVLAQNQRSLKELGTPEQAALKQRLLGIYDSQERIPYVTKRGRQLYNFWRDDKHVRGTMAPHHLAELPQEAADLGDRARHRRAGPRGERELGLPGHQLPAAEIRALSDLAVAREARTRWWCASSTPGKRRS